MLLLSFAMASCKKHQIKKQTRQVTGTFRGQKELYHEESHTDSSKLIMDNVYNSVKEIIITIEKKDDDQILVSEVIGSGILLKYAGHNMESTYHYWSRYYDKEYTVVYYPSTDSLFIVGRYFNSSGKPPWNSTVENHYFKGKRVD